MVDKKRGSYNKIKKNAIRPGSLWPLVRQFANQEAKPILELTKNPKINAHHRKALMNYLVVRTVTIFEMFLLNEAHRLAKKDRRKTKKLFTHIQTNASIEDQLISVYSFTKLSDVDHVFSTLLDKKFLAEIKNQSIQYAPDYSYEPAHIPYTKPLHNNWDFVCKIFELRNGIVHHNRLVNFAKYSEIRNLIGGIIQFLMCSSTVTDQN